MEMVEREYYDSGELLHEYTVIEGRKNGPFKRYYVTGALRMVANYCDDLMEGPEEEYYENGQLQVRRVYSLGRVVDSVVVAMHKDGSLAETEEWRNGRCRCYDIDHRLTREFELVNGLREGIYRCYFRNGNLSEELMFVEGRRYGRCRLFHKNGNLCIDMTMGDNGPEGEYRVYHDNGKLKIKCYYKNGVLDGEDYSYYESGILQREALYKMGMLMGKATRYHENGRVEWKREFENGIVKDGNILLYDEDGKVVFTEIWENGIMRAYNEDGVLLREGGFMNFYEVGEHRTFYPNAKLHKRMYFRMGRMDGTAYMYGEDGVLIRKTAFADDKVDGEDIFYYPNGAVREKLVYDRGTLIGDELFYENGNVNWRYSISGGVRNGMAYQFFEEGNLRCEMPYRDDVPEGLAKFYDFEGALVLEIPYEKGRREGLVKTYNEYGLVETESLYADNQYCGGLENYYEDGTLRNRCEMNYELPEGEELEFHDNGTIASKVRYMRGMPVDGQYERLDENGNPDGYYEYKNGEWRLYGPDGELCMEWHCYRNRCNGSCHINDPENGSYDGYIMDDEPCDSLEDFLDLTFSYLAAKCTERFGSVHNEDEFKEFFAAAYEKSVNSIAAQVEYDDYAELDACFTRELPDDRYVDYLVREFILRLRLPNDGDTEREIVHDFKEMVGV